MPYPKENSNIIEISKKELRRYFGISFPGEQLVTFNYCLLFLHLYLLYFSFFSSVFYCLFGFSVKRLRSFILSPSLMYSTYSQIRAYSEHRNFVSRFHLTVPWLNIFRNESIFWELWFIKSLYSNHLWKTFHESCIFFKDRVNTFAIDGPKEVNPY